MCHKMEAYQSLAETVGRADRLMDLLEYQAKDLFRNVGIPVLPAQRIDQPQDLKQLTIPYPVVLKSQVRTGGRGRLGGVRFVENTIDAIAAARSIFNLPIMGEYPKALLAEAKYNADREFYLAVALNRSTRRPVLLGSQQGGVNVQSAIDQMQHVVLDQEFSPYYARRLAIKMGLTGPLIDTISDVLQRMYHLFIEHDLDLVEINPLGVSPDGQIMALDGKVTVNDNALGRHADLAALDPDLAATKPMYIQDALIEVEADGTIGILCNGAGLTMATMDLVAQAGGKAACFLNIGGETRWDLSPQLLLDRLRQGLEQLLHNKHIRVLLINLVCTSVPCDQVAEVIARQLQQRSPQAPTQALNPEQLLSRATQGPMMVVRLVGPNLDKALAIFDQAGLPLLQSLDEAVLQATSINPSPGRRG